MKNIPYICFLLISLSAVIVTIIDKYAAKKSNRRVPEKALFILASLGGSLFMYITMKTIRHKTKHKRFMIGLPIIMILQIVIPFFVQFIVYKIKMTAI